MWIYTGTVNGRYILKSDNLGNIKAQATRILSRNGSAGTGRLYVTCREAGELVETLRFERNSSEGDSIQWKEKNEETYVDRDN